MKRIISIILSVLFCLICFSGCSQKTTDNGKLNIVCTVFPQYDFIREIAGDSVNLKMLVPLGVESHDFKLENLTIVDLNTVSTADLVVYIGGESDSDWIEELKETVNNQNIKWLPLTETTELLPEAISNGLVTDLLLDHEHEHDEMDEHVWASPKRAVEIVNKLTDVLCELDTVNAEQFKSSSARYIEKLNTLDKNMSDVVANAKVKTLIFADRFPFRYLCTDYGLNFVAAFNGCSVSTDPSVSQITALSQEVRNTRSTVVFYMENSKPEYANRIASLTKSRALMLHSCHTITNDEFKTGVNYLSLMSANISQIWEALK